MCYFSLWHIYVFNTAVHNDIIIIINYEKGNKRRRVRGKVNGINKINACLLLELDLCKVALGTLGPTIKTDEVRLMFYSFPCFSQTVAILVFQNNHP